MFRRMIPVLAFLFLAGISAGAEINVPGDYPTIQDAIDASSSGDTIWVMAGTYVENIDFIGKDIELMSELGSIYTTIDGNQSGPVVTFINGETQDAVLSGFTLTNGLAANTNGGGGINCQGASPTIECNIIKGNEAIMHGGGIYTYGSGCLPMITDNIIIDNTAWRGAGISVSSNPLSLANNVIAGNTATYQGGGVFLFGSNARCLTSNTIVGNSAAEDGGGIFVEEGWTDTEIVNTILWDNQAPTGPEIYQAGFWSPSMVTISYSDVMGGMNSVYVESNGTLNWGAGMIDTDPLFADRASHDYHLEWDSLCLDSGNPSALGLLDWDFEDDPRLDEFNTVSIGADEFWFHLYHEGENIPGSTIDMNVVGFPGQPVIIGLSNDMYDPPLNTPYGDLYVVFPLLWQRYIGAIPSSGNLHLLPTIPPGWNPGDLYILQALVGQLGVSTSRLTNFSVLWIE